MECPPTNQGVVTPPGLPRKGSVTAADDALTIDGARDTDGRRIARHARLDSREDGTNDGGPQRAETDVSRAIDTDALLSVLADRDGPVTIGEVADSVARAAGFEDDIDAWSAVHERLFHVDLPVLDADDAIVFDPTRGLAVHADGSSGQDRRESVDVDRGGQAAIDRLRAAIAGLLHSRS